MSAADKEPGTDTVIEVVLTQGAALMLTPLYEVARAAILAPSQDMISVLISQEAQDTLAGWTLPLLQQLQQAAMIDAPMQLHLTRERPGDVIAAVVLLEAIMAALEKDKDEPKLPPDLARLLLNVRSRLFEWFRIDPVSRLAKLA